jgi:hypothetical protein
MQKLALPAALILRPQLERARGHLCTGLIADRRRQRMMRVSPPEDAREFPGPQASSSVTRGAALEKMQRGPAAEGSGADDCDVRVSSFHG